MPTVIVYWSPGRTPNQKVTVIENITNTLVNDGGARKEDVLILFQNIESGDAGRAALCWRGRSIILPMQIVNKPGRLPPAKFNRRQKPPPAPDLQRQQTSRYIEPGRADR